MCIITSAIANWTVVFRVTVAPMACGWEENVSNLTVVLIKIIIKPATQTKGSNC